MPSPSPSTSLASSDMDCSTTPTPTTTPTTTPEPEITDESSPAGSIASFMPLPASVVRGWGGTAMDRKATELMSKKAVGEFNFYSACTMWALVTPAIDIYRIANKPQRLKNVLFMAGLIVRLYGGGIGFKSMLARFYHIIHPHACETPSTVALLCSAMGGGRGDATVKFTSGTVFAFNKTTVAESLWRGKLPGAWSTTTVMLAACYASLMTHYGLCAAPVGEFLVLAPSMLLPLLALHIKFSKIPIVEQHEMAGGFEPIRPSSRN